MLLDTRIHIPADCILGEEVFSGCGTVYVFAAANSDAQRFCEDHPNCLFIEEQ